MLAIQQEASNLYFMPKGYRYTDNIDFIKVNIDPYKPEALMRTIQTWVPVERQERALEAVLFARNIGFIGINQDISPNDFILLTGTRFNIDRNMAIINELDQNGNLY
ncbi:MAG: hypothetical protein WCG30_01320 [Candidatus Saccharibacteria bacterium]